ncbi:response regulator transcription factor [Yinghuangia seranimata]|uniref:response regulator transcription factor n=1 Tax=Yinghuangia seranimata TaxID=408067 RepID=UPI00248CCB36|nr:response regulator transcription factor [Yinghuangia seranimata]MDI2130202.1 response regulator transcription factor [Yinghuangia seranimata]
MPHVLLIEDDSSVRDGMELVLTRHGHRVDAAGTGEQGLELLRARMAAGGPVEIVVLDLMLPGMDGFEVCRRVRALAPVPIIMLTARGDDLDVVSGLEAGADDYVVKPVTARVLEARIRAVLRRADPVPARPVDTFGDLVIDRGALTVARAGEDVPLPPTELRLLLELSSRPGLVYTRERLLELVWEHDFLGDSRLVDAAVGRLRAKIEDTPAQPRYIQTARGFGYRFGPL